MLNQPYPVNEKTPRQIFLYGLLGGGLIAFILIAFQPFGTARVSMANKHLFLVGYGFIAAAVYWVMTLLPTSLFRAESWTVGKQLVTVFLAVLLGVTLSYFYLLLLGGSPDWASYRYFTVNAFKVAVFPVVAWTLIDYYLKLRKYEQGARQHNAARQVRPEGVTAPGPELTLTDDQHRPVLTLPADRVWCLRSDRNYVDVFHLDADERPVRTTLRNTLTQLADGLPDGFLRCHRSYFVNADLVRQVSGNAQGYRLHNPDFSELSVPVSRGKSAAVLGAIRG